MRYQRKALFEAKGITKRFGGFVALDSVSLKIREGDIHAIIGPNGAGKTTFFNLITGILSPDEGQMCLGGEQLTDRRPSRRTARGIARTFQNIRLFKDMTVLENILVAQHGAHFASLWQASRSVFVGGKVHERSMRDTARELLEFVGLGDKPDRMSSDLPYGQLRLLEIARALATNPRLLLLDEPAAGMNPAETQRLDEIICRIRDRGITPLLVEHDMQLVMDISDRVTVFNFGKLIAEGAPDEIQDHAEVVTAYLGTNDPL